MNPPKSVLLLLSCYLLLGIDTTLKAQNIANPNAWIDYSATYYKIKIGNNAIHRLPQTVLATQGLGAIPGSDFKIFYKGQEIPLYVSNNSIMGTNDYIEFYGQKNDGEFDTQLYQYASWQPTATESLFSDTSAYFLTVSPDTDNLRFVATSNDLSDLPAPEPYFIHAAYTAYPENHYAGKPFNIAGTNKTYSDFDNTEGFISNLIALGTERVFSLPTPAAYTVAGINAAFSARVIGRSNDNDIIGDHHLQIDLNGNTAIDTTYEGYTTLNLNRTLDPAQLNAANTAISVKSLAISGADVNSHSVAWLRIDYPRSFDFGGTQSFVFEIDNNGDKYLEISNFIGGNTPVLYDLSNRLRILPLLQGGIYKVKLNQIAGGAAKRRLVLFNTEATAFCNIGCQFPNCLPDACQLWTLQTLSSPIQYTDYSQAANEGNYLIISHPTLRTGTIDQVARYRDYRNSAAGGNHQAIIVNVEELYDQFAWGIAKHPLAIKNFVNYAISQWAQKPNMLFLLGKGVSYNHTHNFKPEYNACLVPTYGFEASDVLLSAPNIAVYQPQLATGRIPAHTANDVRIYLDKIITYEGNFTDNCSIENRQWMKHALHIAGGSNLSESESFLEKLSEYRQLYEDTMMGGKVVYTYNKISEDVVEQADLGETLNKGLAMIMFFGHSAGSYWNLDLGKPENYTNYGKYPFVMTGSCFVGDIYGLASQEPGMAEDYILADGLGAIGFLATASFGFPSWLHTYSKDLHQQFCRDMYRQPLGECIKKTIQNVSAAYPNQEGAKITCQEYAFVGDPALHIAAWQKPELALQNSETQSSISFEPTTVTADINGFTVRVAVANLGTATADSTTLRIERRLADGSLFQTISQRIALPRYADTIDFYLTMGDPSIAGGNNQITAIVDADNQIDEDCETNNHANRTLFIFSDLLVPIVPCNYAIVGTAPVTLHASTGIPLSPARNYILEIDTTEQFNSPIHQQTNINSIGGVLKWQPAVNYTDNTVYYWRSAPAGDNPQWKRSSFLYRNGAAEGYNQSHYQQLAHNDLVQMQVNPNAPYLRFARTPHQLRITNNYNSKSAISIALDENVLGEGSQMGDICDGGIAFVVFKPVGGQLEAFTSQKINALTGCDGRGTYYNQQIAIAETRQIEFRTSDPQQVDSMLQFIQTDIPNGYYVAAYSVREHRLQSLAPAAQTIIQAFFNGMGIAQISSISNAQGFIALGQKGSNGTFAPVWATSLTSALNFDLNVVFEVPAESGTMKSLAVGPALSWASLEWQTTNTDATPADEWALNVYGVGSNGTETLLFDHQTASNLDLSAVSATEYPFLRLALLARDTAYFTPPQLDYWRVWFDRRAELALDAQYHYQFHADTITTGDVLSLAIGVTNPENSPLSGINTVYTIIAPDGSLVPGNQPIVQDLAAGQSSTVVLTAPTTSLEGNYVLAVELNPNEQLPEKFSFNNLLYVPFTVIKDKVNPYIDVTFDGRHIGEGELVSAKPEIWVRVKDDNPYLALNDTADFYIALRYTDPANGLPSLLETPIPFNSPLLQFVPPSDAVAIQGNNAATIRLRPEFADAGLYELIVRAKDRSGNAFAQKAYSIQFRIEPKPMISNVVNYPNPFTTQTRFVLVITGSEIPQDIRLQIMTVSGRVVREITQTELGNLHIGQNITDFAWDGTDQFGNTLANGVYLYRVHARLNGQPIDRYATAADSFFNDHGWGKMYLLR